MQQASPESESTLSGTCHQVSPPSVNTDRSHDGASAKITRRSHRKSRTGCKNCKTRRIKCDETKPHCKNCERRRVLCDHAKPATVQSSYPQNDSNSTSGSNSLPISEIELTFYWTTSTCHSLSAWPSGATQFQAQTAEIGFDHPYVLHLIFAFTALHLAFCRPDRRERYSATAEHHYDRALVLVAPEVANISSSNCDSVFLSVQLVCFVSWARGPQPGEYLAFSKNGRSDWLIMFRGIRTTLESVGRIQFEKTHAPAVRSKSRPLPSQNEPPDYKKQLIELREHISFVSSDSTERNDNLHAMDILQEIYHNRYQGVDGEYHVVFGWLYRMSEDFLDRLQQRNSIALIMYAHFVVLMHDMERFWYMKGWTHHVMHGIWDALETEHRNWVKWPSAVVGWIAP